MLKLLKTNQELNVKFYIENMTCGGCAKSVKKAIASVDPGSEIKFDIPNRTVELNTEDNEYLFTLVLAAEGYTAVSV
ncbi:MAG TPA: heavy-metal-associated domain-containing protein [Croceicoccus sp.]|nr:heavy-metal-associated domain-containing protein [Croceicoccus sp.]